MRNDPWDPLEKARDMLLEVESTCGDRVPGISAVRRLLDEAMAGGEPTPAEILRILGHELKAPLSAMAAMLAVVDDSYLEGDPARAREMVGRARRRAEELIPLVDDIMELGSLAEGTELPDEEFDLAAVTRDVSQFWEPAMAGRGVTLEYRVPAVPVPVTGSAGFIRRVVTNLVMNAFKYNRPGGRVDLDLSAENGQALLRVSDTGVGIPPEDLPHIFTFLYRGRQARRNPDGGLGLGLSLVRQIVERHGGEIHAESVVGEGTDMIVRLPLNAGGPSALPKEPGS
jgi:two-component system phosphate regulon sensor histidine kinase PhoR